MSSREETRNVLERHTQELQDAWKNNPEEIRALFAYIEHVSNDDHAKEIIKTIPPEKTLLFFGGRIPQRGIEELMLTFCDAKIACFISENTVSKRNNPLEMDARELAGALQEQGWLGDVRYDLTAENTGDQVEALVAYLKQQTTVPQTVIVSASIDHIGRMTATTIDALETHGFLEKGIRILPLSLGRWGNIQRHPFTSEDLAFGNEHARMNSEHDYALFIRLGGQYTFRWQRSHAAKQRGEFLGRAIVTPSHALELFTRWGMMP